MNLQQEIWDLEIEISYIQRKLRSKIFAANVPEYILDEEKETLENLQQRRLELLEELERG